MSTLVHRPFASSLRTHSENTKISWKRQASGLSIVLSGLRNSRESSNRSRLDVPCFARMLSSSQTNVSYLSSPVYSERYSSLQKSSCPSVQLRIAFRLTAVPDLAIRCIQAAHPCLPQAQGPQRRTRARHFFHLHAPKPRDLHVRASLYLFMILQTDQWSLSDTVPSSLEPSPNRRLKS